MIVTRKAISRRTVLRGIGATVSLPLLDAMIPALTAQVKTAAKPIRRLGVVYHPNGVIYDKWLPKGVGADFVGLVDDGEEQGQGFDRALARPVDPDVLDRLLRFTEDM